MNEENLRRELDSLETSSVTGGNYTSFANPVEARAGFELVDLIERGTDIKSLGVYGSSNYGGIYIPTETLGSVIYVPKPVLEQDEELKKQNEYAGMRLFDRDQMNVFGSKLKSQPEDRRLVEKILYGSKLSEKDAWRNGAELLNQLTENSSFRADARSYSIRMLEMCREKYIGQIQPEELQDLFLQFVNMYLSEMGVSENG